MFVPFAYTWLRPENKKSKEEKEKEKQEEQKQLKCPYCGAKALYIGLHVVECTDPVCKWYCEKKNDTEVQE